MLERNKKKTAERQLRSMVRFGLTVIGPVVSALLSGCAANIRFHFGQPPRRYTGPDRFRQCVSANSIIVRRASAKYSGSYSVGFAFYRGQKRLNADKALALLKNPSLIRQYAPLYNEPRAKKRREYIVGIVMQSIGWPLLVGGAAMLVAEKDMSEKSKPYLVTAGGLIGAVGLILVPLSISYFIDGGSYADTEKICRKMFLVVDHSRVAGFWMKKEIAAKEHLKKLARAVVDYNRRVRDLCGQKHPVGLPTLPQRSAPR